MRGFPNGRYDDQVDAWSQGGNYLQGRVHGVMEYYRLLLEERAREDATSQIFRY